MTAFSQTSDNKSNLKKLFLSPTFKFGFIAAIVYLLIAIVLTWPLISKFTTHIPGVDEDSATHIWYLWWFKWAFVEGHSPLFKTDWIFHPQIIDRIFDVHTFVNAAISLPFQYLVGLIASSNLLFYLNFFLTGLGMFALVKKLTDNYWSAFIAGLIVVFMPYTWGQILDNHTNLYTIWFIPFYLLFLLRTLGEKGWKNPLLAGLFFGLQALNDLTLTTFMIAATLMIGFYYFVFQPGIIRTTKLNLNWETIKRLLLLGTIFTLVFLPLLVPVSQAIMGGQDPGSSLHDQQVWSAQPQNFLIPSGNNPFLRDFSRTQNVNAIEGSIYLGFIAVVLALIGIIYYLAINRYLSRQIGLWVFLFISFLILSLGPCAHYLGINTNLSFCSGTPLPFVFFHKLPFIGGIQEPIRMQIYTMICLAVLAGFGIKATLTRFNFATKILLTLGISLLILFEYYTPLPLTDLTAPPIYKTIQEDRSDFSVLSLPVGWNNQSFNTGFSPIGSLQFFQTAHEHKSFRATVARVPTQNIHYYLDKPLFKYLTQPDLRIPDKDDLDPDLAQKTFSDFHIKYIVMHKKYYLQKKKSAGQTQELIEGVLKAEKIQEDNDIVTYKLK